jgi:hypothetical protein
MQELSPGMDKEWIANLAQDIKQKGHEAAEDYGRSQHQAGIISSQSRQFFSAFAVCLEENVNEIKRQLQGDVTASDTTFKANGPSEIRLIRSRFPWFDASITHRDATIALDYAKGLGVAGDPTLDRKSSHFDFHVDADDTLSIKEAFSEDPKQFHEPAEVARHITQLLFEV